MDQWELVSSLLRSTISVDSWTHGDIRATFYEDSAAKKGLFAAVEQPGFAYYLLKKKLVRGVLVAQPADRPELVSRLGEHAAASNAQGCVLLVQGGKPIEQPVRTIVGSAGALDTIASTVQFAKASTPSEALNGLDASPTHFSEHSFRISIPKSREGIPADLDGTSGSFPDSRALAAEMVKPIIALHGSSSSLSLAFTNWNSLADLELSVFMWDVVSALRAHNKRIVTVSSFPASEDAERPTTGFSRDPSSRQGVTVTVWNNPPDPSQLTHQCLEPVNSALLKFADEGAEKQKDAQIAFSFSETPRFIAAIRGACESVNASEPEITRMDTVAGDGDAGETLALGANITLEFLRSLSGPTRGNAAAVLSGMSDALERGGMGGTSGGLYRIFLSSLATEVSKLPAPENGNQTKLFAEALRNAVNTLLNFTRARKGDRTLLDPLIPFAEELVGAAQQVPANEAFARANAKAVDGFEATKSLKANVGRASYVAAERIGEVGDAGARGVLAILSGIQQVLFPEDHKGNGFPESARASVYES